jgi:hypothetical protein
VKPYGRLTRRKGRPILCTVPGLTPNCSAVTHTPGRSLALRASWIRLALLNLCAQVAFTNLRTTCANVWSPGAEVRRSERPYRGPRPPAQLMSPRAGARLEQLGPTHNLRTLKGITEPIPPLGHQPLRPGKRAATSADSEHFRSTPKTPWAFRGMFRPLTPFQEDAMTWSDSPWVFLYSIVLTYLLVAWAYVPA